MISEICLGLALILSGIFFKNWISPSLEQGFSTSGGCPQKRNIRISGQGTSQADRFKLFQYYEHACYLVCSFFWVSNPWGDRERGKNDVRHTVKRLHGTKKNRSWQPLVWESITGCNTTSGGNYTFRNSFFFLLNIYRFPLKISLQHI